MEPIAFRPNGEKAYPLSGGGIISTLRVTNYPKNTEEKSSSNEKAFRTLQSFIPRKICRDQETL